MIVACTNWRNCGSSNSGRCDLGLFGGRPSFGVCLRVCDQYDGPARGRGDLLHKLIKTATLGLAKPCNGCKERRVNGNAKHPSKQAQQILAGVGD